MPDLQPNQFRMVPKVNQKPGSQGTLFSGGETRAGAGQPWPRGYSPERRRQVVHALRMTDAAQTILRTPNRGKPTPKTVGAPERRRDTNLGVETIARSTVPVEHLKGVEAEFGTEKAGRDRSGTYYRNISGFDVTRGHAQGPTAIHEIGHHVSDKIDRTDHAEYDTPERRGTEEAYAENYAETHYRDHRGRPLADFHTTPYGWSDREQEHEQGEFVASFHRKRGESPGAQRRHAEQTARNEKMMSAPPPGTTNHVRGQLPLYDRQITGWGSNEKVEAHPANLDYIDTRPAFPWRDRRNA